MLWPNLTRFLVVRLLLVWVEDQVGRLRDPPEGTNLHLQSMCPPRLPPRALPCFRLPVHSRSLLMHFLFLILSFFVGRFALPVVPRSTGAEQ